MKKTLLHCLLPTLLLAALVACSRPATPTPRPPAPTATLSPTPLHIVFATTVPAPATATAEPATAVPATEPPSATLPPPTATQPPPPTAAQSPTVPPRIDPVVTSLVVTPDQPPTLYAVVGSRLFRSADKGASWTEERYEGLPAGVAFHAVTIDYRHPETMYGLTREGIYRREGTLAWTLVNTLHATALAVDLENPDVLWAGVYRSTEMDAVIVRSEDRGRTWGKTDWGVAAGGWTTDILVDPNRPSTLWAVVRGEAHHNWPPGDLYRGGRDGHWERLDLGRYTPALGNTDSCFAAGIAYDPNANLLFMGCDLSYFNNGNLFMLRSPNAGAADSGAVSWEVATHFATEPPQGMGSARPLAVDAREPKSLFISTSIQEPGQPLRYRILVSHDGGSTWDPLPLRGLPQAPSD